MNRVAWALVHLTKTGLAGRVRHAVYRLTEDGRQLLRQPPPRIDLKFLRNYPAYAQWQKKSQTGKSASSGATRWRQMCWSGSAARRIRYNTGVRLKTRYEVKRIDEDYFAPEDL